MRNIQLKVFSIFIAVLLWYYVANNVSTLTLSIPIEIKNPPSDKIILSTYAEQAEVKISGPSFMLSGIASSLPSFKIVIPKSTENRFVAVLEPEQLSFPSAVKVDSIEPREIELIFDDRISKEVPIEIPKLGMVAEDLQLKEVQTFPSKISIIGPKTELDKIQRLEAYPIDLRELKKGEIRKEISLRKPGNLITSSVEKITILLKVTEVEITKKFENLPVEIRSLDGYQYTVNPIDVSIQVSAPKDIINILEPQKIIPYIRISKDVNTSDTVEVLSEVPAEVSVVELSPPSLKVSIVKTKKGKKKNEQDPVQQEAQKKLPGKKKNTSENQNLQEESQETAIKEKSLL
jgi:hypothetical protein